MNITQSSRLGGALDSVFDRGLLARYARQLLVETAYPDDGYASDFGEADFVGQARASNGDPIPPPLSLCLGLPFGWQADAAANPAARIDGEALLRRLCREIEAVAALFDRDRCVQHLHLGRGVADALDVAQTTELLDSLSRHFSLARDGGQECSIEIATLPGAIGGLDSLTRAGFNRLCGIVPDFSAALGSVHADCAIEAALTAWAQGARSAGFRHIDASVLVAEARQSCDQLRATLRRALSLQPDRIVLRRAPANAAVDNQVDADEAFLDLLECALTTLEAAGYRWFGLGWFVRDTDPLCTARRDGRLRHDLHGFSASGDCDLLGIGPGARSRIGDSISCNIDAPAAYCDALDQGRLPIVGGRLLSDDDLIRRDAIHQLLCVGVIDVESFSERHRIDFPLYFASALACLRERIPAGAIAVDHHRLLVTQRGRYLLPAIAACMGVDDADFRTIAGNTDCPDTP